MQSKISFKNSKNQLLSGVVHVGSEGKNRPWVILCHGMFSSKEGRKARALAERCEGAGLNALRFDFTSCGESEGEPGLILYGQQVRDVSSAVDFLEDGYTPSRLSLVGSSMGAATAILHAARRPYKLACVVLIASPSSTLQYVNDFMSEDQVREWKKTGMWESGANRVRYEFADDARPFNILESARLLHLPTLVLHGSGDELVPLKCAQEIYAALPKTRSLTILNKADHQFTKEEDRERVVKLTVEWCRTFGA
ncbi:MAG: alpha/beta fold hydrolase [Nitrospirae bacterium]|nr:alpha/beta fold hydrolase [Nitrospirota bacterium]